MLHLNNLHKFRDVLFTDRRDEKMKELTPAERAQLKSYRACFTESVENPSIPDTQLRDFLNSEFNISESQGISRYW